MIGMLWHDPDPKKPLDQKIQEAADYYKNKYGASPNLCDVSISAEGSAPAGIELRRSKHIWKNHFLIGVSDAVINP